MLQQMIDDVRQRTGKRSRSRLAGKPRIRKPFANTGEQAAYAKGNASLRLSLDAVKRPFFN